MQKGKNQPAPFTVEVTESTDSALHETQPASDDLSQPVFGLTGETLPNRMRAVARATVRALF